MECGKKGQKLCEREECEPCFSKRFSSVENSKYMVEGQVDSFSKIAMLPFVDGIRWMFWAQLSRASNGLTYFIPQNALENRINDFSVLVM